MMSPPLPQSDDGLRTPNDLPGRRSGLRSIRLRCAKHALIPLALLVLIDARAAEYIGIVHARHQLSLSVPMAGIVTLRAVEPGTRVDAQQTLIVLDDRQQQLESERRKTVLEDRSEIDSNRERIAILEPLAADADRLIGSSAAISREDVARTRLDLIASRGRVAQLEAQKQRERIEFELVDYEREARHLKAPVAGIVTRVNLDVGEWARPGDTVVELVDAAELNLRVNLPIAQARKLRLGEALAVRFEAALGLAPANGKVSFVSPAADPASGLAEVRVAFANPGGRIPPGIKASVQLEGGTAR